MANKYKFGATEFDTDLFLKNLSDNVDSYLNSRNWSEGQKEEFKRSYKNYTDALREQSQNNTNRFSTDEFGTITDLEGKFSNTDNDDIDPVGSQYYYNDKGEQITSDDYKALKPKQQGQYKAFNSNRAFATFAFQVGQALRDKLGSKTEDKSKAFDTTKHGFERYWQNDFWGGNSDGDVTIFTSLDKDGSTKNQAARLRESLKKYIDAGSWKGLDFKDTAFGSEENYANKLQALYDELATGYGPKSKALMAGLGFSKDLTNLYTTPPTNPYEGLTPEQKQAAQEEEAKAKQQSARDKAWNDFTASNKAVNESLGNYKAGTNDIKRTIATYGGAQRMMQLHPLNNAIAHLMNRDGFFNGQEAALGNLLNAYISLDQGRNNWFTPLSTGKYYIRSTAANDPNMVGLIYDPNTGEITRSSLWQSQDADFVNKWRAYWEKKLGYSNDESGVGTGSFKEGGILSMAKGSNQEWYNKYSSIAEAYDKQYASQQKAEKEAKLKDSATKHGRTLAQEKAGQSTEFTGTEYARLLGAAADLGSLGTAFIPGYGTVASAALGIGSTLTNFGADWSDKSVGVGQMFGNLGTNLAMDALGLIPGGGATSKAGKVAKTLVKLTPKIVAAIGVMNGVANKDQIIGSFKKIANPSSMTVDDLKNITAGIGLVTGIGAGAVRGAKNIAMKNAAATGNLEVKTNKGYTKLTPDQFKEVKKLKTIEEQNKKLQELTGINDVELTGRLNYLNGARDHYDWNRLRGSQMANPQGRFANVVGPVLHKSDADIYSGNVNWDRIRIKLPNLGYSRFTSPRNTAQPLNPTQNRQPLGLPAPHSARWERLRQRGMSAEELNRRGIYRKGGILKAQAGLQIPQVHLLDSVDDILKKSSDAKLTETFGAEWYRNLYNQQALRNWYYNDKSKAGKTIINKGSGHWRADNLGTAFAKNQAYTGQSNLVGQDLNTYYNSAFKGKSIDDYITGYNTNAAKIRGHWSNDQTYNAKTAKDHNQLFKAMFSHRSDDDPTNNDWSIGYDPKLEEIEGSSTWLRRMDRYEKEFDQLTDQEKKSRIHKIDLGNGQYGYVYKKANGDIAKLDNTEAETILKNGSSATEADKEQPGGDQLPTQPVSPKISADNLMAIGRAIYASDVNRRLTDMAKKATTPLLHIPEQRTKWIYDSLMDRMRGENALATLNQQASRPLTSDGSLQTAAQQDAQNKGLALRSTEYDKSDLLGRETAEAAWQQMGVNQHNLIENANQNTDQLWNTQRIKSAYDQAFLSKEHTNWDTLLQQLEYEQKTKNLENKSKAETIAMQDIKQAVQGNPNSYGAGLSDSELAVWTKALGGTQVSDLSESERATYMTAFNKVNRAITGQQRIYYGIPDNQWTNVRSIANWGAKARLAKKGGTLTDKDGLAIAKLRAKTADADRFQKGVKNHIDRNDKKIEAMFKVLKPYLKI